MRGYPQAITLINCQQTARGEAENLGKWSVAGRCGRVASPVGEVLSRRPCRRLATGLLLPEARRSRLRVDSPGVCQFWVIAPVNGSWYQFP